MIELFPESPAWSRSPRISFSHDFPQTAAADGIPIDRHPLLDSPTDFHFFSADSYSCSADDLFSDGRILPAAASLPNPPPPPTPPPIDTTTPQPQQPPLPLPKPKQTPSSDQINSKDETLREIMKPIPEESSPAKASCSKNFWRFRRCSSLNSDGGSKLSLLCSLPLLLRSNSTGSVNQTQKKDPSKSAHKPPKRCKPSPPSNTAPSSSLPKPLPPLKKSDKSRPVLNVPPPYISPGTTNLFGFGYFFRHGKDHTSKPRMSRRSTTTTC